MEEIQLTLFDCFEGLTEEQNQPQANNWPPVILAFLDEVRQTFGSENVRGEKYEVWSHVPQYGLRFSVHADGDEHAEFDFSHFKEYGLVVSVSPIPIFTKEKHTPGKTTDYFFMTIWDTNNHIENRKPYTKPKAETLGYMNQPEPEEEKTTEEVQETETETEEKKHRKQEEIPQKFLLYHYCFHVFGLAILKYIRFPRIGASVWDELKAEPTAANFKKLVCRVTNTHYFYCEDEAFGVVFDFSGADDNYIYHCGTDHEKRLFTFRLCELLYLIKKDGQYYDRSYRNDMTIYKHNKYHKAEKWVMEKPERCERCLCWMVCPDDEQPPDGWGIKGLCSHWTAETGQKYKTDATSACEEFILYDCNDN